MPAAKVSRRALVAFFEEHNPSKVPEVDAILSHYAGEHEKLLSGLKDKYGQVPERPIAAEALEESLDRVDTEDAQDKALKRRSEGMHEMAAKMQSLAKNTRQLREQVTSLDVRRLTETEGSWTVAVAPGGRRLAYSTDRNRLVFVDMPAWHVAKEMEFPFSFSLNYSADGTMLTGTESESSVYKPDDKKKGRLFKVDTNTYEVSWGVEGWVVGASAFHPLQPKMIGTLGLKRSSKEGDSSYYLLHVDSTTMELVKHIPLHATISDLLNSQGTMHNVWATVRFTPSGELLHGAPGARKLFVLSWQTGELMCSVPTVGMVWDISVHPSTDLVALACGDKTVKLVNLSVGSTLRTLECEDEVFCAAFSPSGSTLAVGVSETHHVTVFDTSCWVIKAKIDTHDNARCIAWLSETELVVGLAGMMKQKQIEPSSIQVLDANGVCEIATATDEQVKVNVTGMCLSSDHLKLAVFTQNAKKIYLFSARELEELFTIPPPEQFSWGVNPSFSAADDQLACILPLNTEAVALVDLKARTARLMMTGLNQSVGAIGYTHDGHLLLFAGDQTLYIMKEGNGELTIVAKLPNLPGSVETPRYYAQHPMYKYNYLAAIEGTICVADPSGYVSIVRVDEIDSPTLVWSGLLPKVAKLAFAADGKLIVVLDQHGVLYAIDAVSDTFEVKATSDSKQVLSTFDVASSDQLVVSNASADSVQTLQLVLVEGAWKFKLIKQIPGSCDLLFSGPGGTFVESTKQGDIRLRPPSGKRDLVWALKDMVGKEFSSDMVQVLKEQPSWAMRALPETFLGTDLLHCAVLLDRVDWIEPLCQHGAHPARELPGRPRSSALDLAIRYKKEVLASALVQAMAGFSYPRYGGFLPAGFASTITGLIELDVPCNELMAMISPPQSHVYPDPPTHAHQKAPVVTLTAKDAILPDYSVLARSKTQAKTGDHGAHVRIDVLCVTHLLDEQFGLLEALLGAETSGIYTSVATKALLTHLWLSFGYTRFLFIFGFVSARLACFCALTAYWSTELSVLLLVLSSAHALLMLIQVRGMGWHVWLRESAHYLEATAVLVQLVIGFISALSDENFEGIDPSVLAVLTLVIWFDFILHLRGFAAVSALLTQMTGILNDSGPFLVVLMVTIVGFAHARLCLGQPDSTLNWAEWERTDVVNVLLGTWDDVVGGGRTIISIVGDDGLYGETSSFVAWLLSVLGTLVMLNMLIAVMSDSFERIQEEVELVRLRQMVSLLLATRPIAATEKFGAYFFTSTIIGRVETSHTHAGFLGEIKKTVNQRAEQLQEDMREMRGENEHYEARLDALASAQVALSDRLSSMEESLGSKLDALIDAARPRGQQ